ncbi:AbrB family transcriptional regulator [Bacillus thuringiensis]|uniref:AbrB family transcriptional regulator n=1 Tax=Bacillus thuringiensis TaxID=1428 RepID=A0A9X7BVJ4_BACTU|nr:AbrB/MazE/SpoVT family DNA-binding domain-containing protein [Bacillus thuringiensis]PGH79630.1 AbrB family transcriptional regulator [Bacillus thuringiensis]
MKSVGIRKIDRLGRCIIPIEIREMVGFFSGTPIEIYVEGRSIHLKKYQRTCSITGEAVDNPLVLDNGQIVLSPEGAKYVLEQLKTYIASDR